MNATPDFNKASGSSVTRPTLKEASSKTTAQKVAVHRETPGYCNEGLHFFFLGGAAYDRVYRQALIWSDKGIFYGSVAEMAEQIGFSQRTVRRVFEDFMATGWFEKVTSGKQGSHSAYYRVLTHKAWAATYPNCCSTKREGTGTDVKASASEVGSVVEDVLDEIALISDNLIVPSAAQKRAMVKMTEVLLAEYGRPILIAAVGVFYSTLDLDDDFDRKYAVKNWIEKGDVFTRLTAIRRAVATKDEGLALSLGYTLPELESMLHRWRRPSCG